MKILITGITGFAGSHLAEYALKQGAEVWGTRRWRSSMANVKHIERDIHWVHSDLTDFSSARRAIEMSMPDRVFHLAAQSFVACSFDQPFETLQTNIHSQLNILECLKRGMFGRMLSIGSSEEYGLVHSNETPIKESNPLRPLSPYGVSKVAQDLLAYQYFKSYGLDVVRARAFNHEGPRRGHVFVTSTFAKQVAEIEAGLRDPVIKHGNLTTIRDFTDVRDTVRAYWLLLEKGKFGEVYNIASGDGWKIFDVLKLIVRFSGRDDIQLVEDPSRWRPSDVPILIGCADKLKQDTGWCPTIAFPETMIDLLDYWRAKIRGVEKIG